MSKPEKNIPVETQATVAETPISSDSRTGKTRKLSKDVTYENGGAVIITVVNGENGPMTFNFSDLPAEIQAKFGPFGLGHKLGDAAAGESGVDAEKSITAVWKGLLEGNWTTRAPAAPKIDKKSVIARFQNMDDATKEQALNVLREMGIDPSSMGLA